jgi:hypothetical protein
MYEDNLRQFIQQVYPITIDFKVSISEFYDRFIVWSKINNYPLPSCKRVSQLMYKMHFGKYRTSKACYYTGQAIVRDQYGLMPVIVQYCLLQDKPNYTAIIDNMRSKEDDPYVHKWVEQYAIK